MSVRFAFIVALAAAVCGACQPQQPQQQGPDIDDESAMIDVTRTAFSPAPLVAGWPGLALFDPRPPAAAGSLPHRVRE